MTACQYIDTTGSKPRRCRRKIDLTKLWAYCPECMQLMKERRDPNSVALLKRSDELARSAHVLAEAIGLEE
jgi:hypothetical protein